MMYSIFSNKPYNSYLADFNTYSVKKFPLKSNLARQIRQNLAFINAINCKVKRLKKVKLNRSKFKKNDRKYQQ